MDNPDAHTDRSAPSTVAAAPLTPASAARAVEHRNLITPYEAQRGSPELVINEGNYYPAGHRLAHAPTLRASSPLAKKAHPELLLTTGIRLSRRELSASRVHRHLVRRSAPRTPSPTVQLRSGTRSVVTGNAATPQQRFQRLARTQRAARPYQQRQT